MVADWCVFGNSLFLSTANISTFSTGMLLNTSAEDVVFIYHCAISLLVPYLVRLTCVFFWVDYNSITTAHEDKADHNGLGYMTWQAGLEKKLTDLRALSRDH